MKQLQYILKWLSWSFFTRGKHDLRVVLLCLLVAALIWFLNAMNKQYATDLSYPVRFSYDANRVIPLSDLPKKITFNASGSGWDLFKRLLNFSVTPVEIVPGGLPEKKYLLAKELQEVFSGQVKGVRINYMVADTIHLDFDPLVVRTLPLKINTSRLPVAEEYVLKGAVGIEPDSVVVSGAARVVASLDSIVLLSVNKTNIKQQFEQRLKIPIERTHLITTNIREARVQFDVEETRRISMELPLTVLNKPVKSKKVIFPKILVSMEVGASKASGIGTDELQLIADYKKMGLDSLLTVEFPAGHLFKSYSLSPSVIDLKHAR